MNEAEVREARTEAQRFLRRCDEYLRRVGKDQFAQISGCKEGGALRRASLDLTRSLATMRRPA
jgi:hypothetical protein